MAAFTRPPAAFTRFVGREPEIGAVREALSATRILTLTGAGGSGKTRLALRVAELLQAEPVAEGPFPDGVLFVPFAAVVEPALVIDGVAAALGLPATGAEPLEERVAASLGARRMLLVLDNFEHVRAAAPLIPRLLAAAPGVRALVTSREPLRLSGERELPVPPLASTAGSPETVPEAVQLFEERARAALPSFRVDDANLALVAAICERLDGLPLAIELAAARVKLLPLPALLARLEAPLALLTGGSADAPERHRTLRAAIDWSYGLLSGAERQAFRRLAVFVDRFDLNAAEALCAGLASDVATLDLLAALVDKSLLHRAGDGSEPQLAMLATIRDYARGRLVEAGELDAAERAHAEHFLALAERARPLLHGPAQALWFARLEAAHGDLQAALAWALREPADEEALRFGAALWWFWHVRGHGARGRQLLQEVLRRAGEREATFVATERGRRLLAEVEYGAGVLALFQGDYDAARALLTASAASWRSLLRAAPDDAAARRALADALVYTVVAANLQTDAAAAAPVVAELETILPAIDDPHFQARMLFNQARGLLLQRGDHDAARPLLERAATLFRSLGDLWGSAQTALDLGLACLYAGAYDSAERWFAEALASASALGERSLVAQAHNNLGEVARCRGDLRSADEHYDASMRLYRDLGARPDLPRVRHNRAYVALRRGDTSAALALFREALEHFHQLRMPRGVAECLAGMAAVATTHGELRRAASLWGAAERLHSELGTTVWPADALEHARYQRRARDGLPSAEYTAAWAEGAALPYDDALRLASTDYGDPAAAHPPAQHAHHDLPEPLTPRELDVLRLVALGLSNTDIAAQLALSRFTVQNHLRNIYGKLGVASRSAATRFAWEHSLVTPGGPDLQD